MFSTSSNFQATIASVALTGVLITYVLLASIDIGAGCYFWLAGARLPWRGTHRSAQARATRQAIQRVTQAYLSPVWEVTNVFFIFFVVGMVGFFPASARLFGTALLMPISLATIALVVRGAALAYHHLGHASGVSPRFERALTPIFGLTGLLVLPLLATFVSSAEDGAIVTAGVNSPIAVSSLALWLSPFQLTLAALALAAPLYLGAVALASFAAQRGAVAVARWYRRMALRIGALTAILAVAFGVALFATNPAHGEALLAAWPLLALTAALFGASRWALVSAPRHAEARQAARRYRLASWLALGQVALSLGLTLLTRGAYLVYPTVRLADAITPPATFVALAVTVVIGLAFVLPSLGLLYALFLRAPAVVATQPQATGAPGNVRAPANAPELAAVDTPELPSLPETPALAASVAGRNG